MPTDKVFNMLVALLRMGLGISYAAANERVSPDDWRAVYRLAKKHAVIAVAWDGVECLQMQSPKTLQSLPADLMGKWFADSQAIVAANSRMATQAVAIQESLAAAGFASHILKGVTLATYYPVPAHRQSADIDLWVLPSNAQHLSELRNALIAFLREQPNISMGEIVYHHIETMVNGTDVEFHVTPTWLCNPIHNKRLLLIFTQAGLLTPELQELYTLLHAFRHIYHDGLVLRHVLDYRLVSQANRAAGIPSPDDMYAQLGLQSFADAVSELADHLFGQNDAALSRRAHHLLDALPARQVSTAVQWDYPSETLCVLPWRAVHYLWRKRMNKTKNI